MGQRICISAPGPMFFPVRRQIFLINLNKTDLNKQTKKNPFLAQHGNNRIIGLWHLLAYTTVTKKTQCGGERMDHCQDTWNQVQTTTDGCRLIAIISLNIYNHQYSCEQGKDVDFCIRTQILIWSTESTALIRPRNPTDKLQPNRQTTVLSSAAWSWGCRL